MHRAFTLPAAALTSLALAASVAVAGTADAHTISHVPVGRAALRVYATNTHAAVAPATVNPGIVHIRNIGRDVFLVLQAKHDGATARQAARDARRESPHALLEHFRLLGEAVPAQDSYVRITRGELFFVDVEARKIKAGKIAETVVQGSREDALVPPSHRVLVTRHKQLHVPHAVPKQTWLHVVNRSAAVTSFLFVGVARKATYRALRAVVAHPTLEKLGELFALDVVPLGDAGPHSASWQQFHAVRGRYLAVLLVFSNDVEPHLHHGQVRILHVT